MVRERSRVRFSPTAPFQKSTVWVFFLCLQKNPEKFTRFQRLSFINDNYTVITLSVHSSHCVITVWTASSMPSGGYLCFLSSLLISMRIFARAGSRFCQSIVLFWRKVSVSSFVMAISSSFCHRRQPTRERVSHMIFNVGLKCKKLQTLSSANIRRRRLALEFALIIRFSNLQPSDISV